MLEVHLIIFFDLVTDSFDQQKGNPGFVPNHVFTP